MQSGATSLLQLIYRMPYSTNISENHILTINASLAISAIRAAVVVAFVLAVLKCGIFLLTQSVSIKLSLLDSCFDVSVSLINYAATILSFHKHRWYGYGYDKITGVAAVCQVALLLWCAYNPAIDAWYTLLCWGGTDTQSIEHLDVLTCEIPNPPLYAWHHSLVTIASLIVSLALTLVLVRYQRHVIERTGHLIVTVDRVHYTTDILTNCSLLGFFIFLACVNPQDYPWIELFDPILTIMLFAYILACCSRVLKDAWYILMDRRMPPHKEAEIVHLIAQQVPDASGIFVTNSRFSGVKAHFEFRLPLDPSSSIRDAQTIVQDVQSLVATQNAECVCIAVPCI
jgi:ferrous-iron efflux pump FieF